MKIKIQFESHRNGGITMEPVCKRRKNRCMNRIVAHHKIGAPEVHVVWRVEVTEEWLRGQTAVYVQTDWEAEEVMDRAGLKRFERRDMERGWPVVKLVDTDLWEHWFCAYNGMPEES